MRTKDVENLENAYRKVLKEDLGLGPQATQTTGLGSGGGPEGVVLSMGGHSIPPDIGKSPLNGDENKMAESQVKSTIEDAMQVLNDLHNSGKVEEWVLTKLATVADRIQSIKKFLQHEKE